MSRANPYRAAGTFSGVSYVERQADLDLLEAIYDNQRYPYILAPRQSGKSSLLSQVTRKLAPDTYTSLFLDLSKTPPQFLNTYASFLHYIVKELCTLASAPKPKDRESLEDALRSVLRSCTKQILIVVDEVDILTHVNFKDDFFSLIRYFFNLRDDDSYRQRNQVDFRRIQFVLAGATQASSLISDKNRSPFNVGFPINLAELTPFQVHKMVSFLNLRQRDLADLLAQRIYEETSGSVYLTQLLCELLWNQMPSRQSFATLTSSLEQTVEAVVQRSIDDVHFTNICELATRDPVLVNGLEAWLSGIAPAKHVKTRLEAIGLSRADRPFRNRLYSRIFGIGGPLTLLRSDSVAKLHSSSQTGESFVRYVSDLYRSLGFTVVPVFDKAFDFLVERNLAGGLKARFLIACKYSNAKSISKAQLEGITSRLASTDYRGADSFVCVSNKPFHKAAISDFFAGFSIKFVTTSELENELLDPYMALKEYLQAYEQKPLFKRYLHLSGRIYRPQPSSESVAEHLESYICQRLESTSNRRFAVAVLGAAGAGKTELIHRLKYHIGQEAIQSNTDKLPIIFYLRDLFRYASLDDFVESTCQRELGVGNFAGIFWQRLNEGRFVILLDGLDEAVASDADLHFAVRWLKPLLQSNSPVVLTSRSQFVGEVYHFRNELQETITGRSALSSSEVRDGSLEEKALSLVDELTRRRAEVFAPHEVFCAELLPLSSYQIAAYLDLKNADSLVSHRKPSTDEIVRWFGEKELASNPLYLSMLHEILRLGLIDAGIAAASVSQVMLAYIHLQLDLDWQKGSMRQLVNRDSRFNLAILVALTMFDSGRHEIRVDDVKVAAANDPSGSGSLAKFGRDELLNDMSISPIFARRPNGLVSFSHVIFRDFLVAYFVFSQLRQFKIDPRLEGEVPLDVLRMLASFAETDEGMKSADYWSRVADSGAGGTNVSAHMRRNLATIRSYMKRHSW